MYNYKVYTCTLILRPSYSATILSVHSNIGSLLANRPDYVLAGHAWLKFDIMASAMAQKTIKLESLGTWRLMQLS